MTAFALGTAEIEIGRPFRDNVIFTGSASMKGAFVLAEERFDNVGYLTVGQMQIHSAPALSENAYHHAPVAARTSLAECREVEGGGES